MTRLSILVGDGPGSANGALLTTMLGRWSARTGVDVTVDVVSAASYPTARADAEDAADGLVVDVELVSHEVPGVAPRVPTVYVDLSFDGSHGRALDGRVVFGRGVDTYVWAATHVAAWVRWPPVTVRYGDDRDQFGELRTPDSAGPHPVVALVHGGFWRAHWALDLMDDLSIDLAAAGWASWNIEYRRGAGSWRHALDDVAAAVDHLAVIAGEHDLAIDRTALVGHSAGGQLVLWAGGRRLHGPVGAATLDPALVVPLAPVTDLVDCARRGLGDRAAQAFLGAEPGDDPARYRLADPMQRLPVGVPTVIVQGLADGPDLIDHNRRFAAAAASVGEPVELIEIEATDHFHVINPTTPAWAEVRRILESRL